MVRADALGSCKEAARYPGQSRELTREYERNDSISNPIDFAGGLQDEEGGARGERRFKPGYRFVLFGRRAWAAAIEAQSAALAAARGG